MILASYSVVVCLLSCAIPIKKRQNSGCFQNNLSFLNYAYHIYSIASDFNIVVKFFTMLEQKLGRKPQF